jgi:Family of unknown function (DUF6082)
MRWRQGSHPRTTSRLLISSAAILIIVAVLVVSPLLLLALAKALHLDWVQLSNIGQSYTGMSAVLSAVAILGVVVSLRLQSQQTMLLRRQTTRQFQFELLQMGMSDPLYASVMQLSSNPTSDHDSFRRHVYATQWPRYLEFVYLAGEISEADLELTLTEECFPVLNTRKWWTGVRKSWIIASEEPRFRQIRSFVGIVDRAYEVADVLGE